MPHSFRRRRLKGLIALTSACSAAAILFTALAFWRERTVQRQAASVAAASKQTSVMLTEDKRRVYPYSIVPGGARTVNEARRAMRDPSVRDHYGAVNLNNLRQVTLTSDLEGYVSYRYGDKIFWTAKKLRLKAGETVFTDGQHIVRGRCLNCYSAMPMMPIRRNEPSETLLDTPVEVPLIALAFPNLPVATAPTLAPPVKQAAAVVAPGAGGGGAPRHPVFGFFPILPIIPPIIHRHHPSPTSGTSSTPPQPPSGPVSPPGPPSGPVPPVAVVAEPSYRGILLGGFLALVISVWLRRVRRGAPRGGHPSGGASS